MRFSLLVLTAVFSLHLAAAPPIDATVPPLVYDSLSRVSANALKAHVSFLASDYLEGRNTPSRGLDIAAEYIAAQFRRAGLQPIPGTQSYFQVAEWKYKQIPLEDTKFVLESPDGKIELNHTHLSINVLANAALDKAPVFVARVNDTDTLKQHAEGYLKGKAVLAIVPSRADLRDAPREQRSERIREANEFLNALRRLKPAMIFAVRGDGETGTGSAGSLIDPEKPNQRRPGFGQINSVHSAALASKVASLPSGETDLRLTMQMPEPEERPVHLKNVIGVLPGSDPQLKDTYVMITAHYDHIGTTIPENGDGIYNGANDDASGTASVMELASVFAAMAQRPRRTLVFMTVFGEERGLLGAQYYAAHPVFPLAKTVADINLEHMGRTDATEGPQINRLSVTGYDFSEVTEFFQLAGKLTAVEIYKDAENSEAFFPRSDNQAFANAGIPAHTFCVAFEFPDYHGLADTWEKIDYENMARVDRTVASAVWMIAQRTERPEWNQTSTQTEKYREARKKEGNKPPQ